jgi:hypothetical protein
MTSVQTTVGGPAWLFCPADRPERYGKAAAAADMVILDFEDGVAPTDKDFARRCLQDTLLDPAHTVVPRHFSCAAAQPFRPEKNSCPSSVGQDMRRSPRFATPKRSVKRDSAPHRECVAATTGLVGPTYGRSTAGSRRAITATAIEKA